MPPRLRLSPLTPVGTDTIGVLRAIALRNNAITTEPLPIEQLAASDDNVVLRFGTVVVKAYASTHLNIDGIAKVMRDARDFAPEVLFADTTSAQWPGVIATRFVPGRNWGRLIASGHIDFRLFAKAGQFLDRIHGRANTSPITAQMRRTQHRVSLPDIPGEDKRIQQVARDAHARLVNDADVIQLHGAFTPNNIILTGAGTFVATGWRQLAGPAIIDVARFLGDALVAMLTAPHTEDWYVDAGRCFLAGYGHVDIDWLRALIGHQLLTMDCPAAQRNVLHTAGRELILSDRLLPWEHIEHSNSSRQPGDDTSP